jgi:PIN domain
MFRFLIDTCVWLDLAKEPKQHPVLGVVEQMVRQKLIELIVPTIVFDEFKRNRERISKDSAKSLSTHFKVVKEAVGKASGDKRKTKAILTHLDDVDHKIPIIGGVASGALDRIDQLLTGAEHVTPTEAIKLRSAERAIARRAPFHQGKNSMADALIIETYADCVSTKAAPRVRCAFVTHNKTDFSDPTNFKRPHPEFKPLFSKIKSLYFVNLPEALRRVDPSFVTDTMFGYSWNDEPRGLSEILKAEDLLFHQVWYNRHWNRRIKIEQGKIKIVEKETPQQQRLKRETTIQRNIWEGALRSAKRVEKRYGKENLGPWTDFEWGMLNGKLSALRWVLDDEWDMLDT